MGATEKGREVTLTVSLLITTSPQTMQPVIINVELNEPVAGPHRGLGSSCGSRVFNTAYCLEGDLNFEESNRFMQEFVFADLKNLNTGFDSPLIFHFDPADFEMVIDRCERLHVRIVGIEVFSSDVELLEIEISPEDGLEWARRSVGKYQGRSDVTISATFEVPDAVLKSIPI